MTVLHLYNLFSDMGLLTRSPTITLKNIGYSCLNTILAKSNLLYAFPGVILYRIPAAEAMERIALIIDSAIIIKRFFKSLLLWSSLSME